MQVEIRQVQFTEVQPLKLAAIRDHIPIKDTNRTDWFLLSLDGEVVACAGVLWMAAAARLKADWVAPEWRGQGYGKMLVEHRLAHIERTRPGTEVRIYSRRPETFERLGFERTDKTSPGGSIMLRRRADR